MVDVLKGYGRSPMLSGMGRAVTRSYRSRSRLKGQIIAVGICHAETSGHDWKAMTSDAQPPSTDDVGA